MVQVTLPPALAAERAALIAACLERLRSEGFADFAVQDYGAYPAPTPIVVPLFNLQVTPDIAARRPHALMACVELASDLGASDVGPRWQALHAWAALAHTELRVYVGSAELARAQALARHWQLDPAVVRGLTKPH